MKPTHLSSPPPAAASAQPDAWASIRRELEGGSAGRTINLAHAAVTRHASGPLRDHPALCWLSADGDRQTLTYGELDGRIGRIAAGFRRLGLRQKQVVASLCDRVPELYLGALAALKAGCVFCALYPTYGPEPIRHRLAASGAALLITTSGRYARIRDLRPMLPDLAHVLIIDAPVPGGPGVSAFRRVQDHPPEDIGDPPSDPESPALVHFTSGTTGMPKGVVHVHAAALHHLLTARSILDLKPGDIYWCTADPGWVTGVVYGFLAPLMAGVKTIIDGADFDAGRWLTILAGQRVNVWYTSPSALRRLMSLDAGVFRNHDLSALRLIFSVGEPLHAAVTEWGRKTLGVPIRDTWWQTETGGIMIAAHPHEPVRAGAMGRPVSGIRIEVLQPAMEPGAPRALCGADETGELAIAAGWPSMFRSLLGRTDAYRQRFSGAWYLSGDLVQRDPEGTFRFVGRVDDMIKTAGHLVSPFEVEAALLSHPDVDDAGVVGVSDPFLGQRVTAHVCLRSGVAPSDELNGRILAHARNQLGPALAPREIVFTRTMPRNPAGKIVRRQLAGTTGPACDATP